METVKVLDLTLPAPMEETIRSLLGRINRRTACQLTAVDADIFFTEGGAPTASPVVIEGGEVILGGIILAEACGAGESYSLNIHKSSDGGATFNSILTAPVVVDDSANAREVIPLDLTNFTSLEAEEGNMFRLVIDYTAGGTPGPATGMVVFVDIAPLA